MQPRHRRPAHAGQAPRDDLGGVGQAILTHGRSLGHQAFALVSGHINQPRRQRVRHRRHHEQIPEPLQ